MIRFFIRKKQQDVLLAWNVPNIHVTIDASNLWPHHWHWACEKQYFNFIVLIPSRDLRKRRKIPESLSGSSRRSSSNACSWRWTRSGGKSPVWCGHRWRASGTNTVKLFCKCIEAYWSELTPNKFVVFRYLIQNFYTFTYTGDLINYLNLSPSIVIILNYYVKKVLWYWSLDVFYELLLNVAILFNFQVQTEKNLEYFKN